MSADTAATASVGRLPEGEAVKENLRQRSRIGRLWHGLFLLSILFGLAALLTLVLDVANDAVGLAVTQSELDADELTGGRPLDLATASDEGRTTVEAELGRIAPD